MSQLLMTAIVCMTGALIFYSVGVLSEKFQGVLKKWHVAIFWLGFICDTTGTSIMAKIAGDAFKLSVHGVTGLIALLLMAFHAVWATFILFKGSEKAKENFHKFSIIVWSIWLIPYVIGVFMGMGA